MAVILRFFLIAMAGSLISCGSGDEFGDSQNPPPPPAPPPRVAQQSGACIKIEAPAGASACQEKQVSLGECLFCLPHFADGPKKLHTAKHIDIKDSAGVNEGGVIFGFGQWKCKNGKWEASHPPICRTCHKKRDLKACLDRWNIPGFQQKYMLSN